MDKEQKQQSPFDLAATRVLERYAWYADRSVDMMPYSEVYKLINSIIDEITVAHLQTVAAICADYTVMVLQDVEHASHLVDALDEAKATIDLLTEHLKAANNTIAFEKRTRLELPRDARGNRIYPDSMIEQWGAIEDLWYTNGSWKIRGHDISAPWIPADKVVVCTEDSGDTSGESSGDTSGEDSGDTPVERSDQATPESKRPRGCKTRSEAEHTLKAFCLGNISIMELLDLLYSSDNDDASEEA